MNGIGRKVAADFVSDAWVGGALPAKEYAAMMSSYGIGPADLSREQITDAITNKTDDDAGEVAEKLWLHNIENSTADDEPSREASETVSADDVAEFRSRQGGGDSPGTVEHERVVNAPGD